MPAVVIFFQACLFHGTYPQPLVYDAGQYWALSEKVEWVGPLPLLRGEGLRTYAYPAFVSLLADGFDCRWVYVVQIASLALLMMSLRHALLPESPRVDVLLSLMLVAFPVLIPYGIVLLADLLGATALVVGFVCLARSLESRSVVWGWAFAFGIMSGFAVQLRPAYLYVPALSFLFVCVMCSEGDRYAWLRRTVTRVALSTCGFIVACLPTLIVGWERGVGLEVVPTEGTRQIVGYHLMLGLSMDRWSSNPPPFEEREEVAREWASRGWSIAPLPGLPSPRVKDFWKEVEVAPFRAIRQGVDHVLCAFDKRELYPYTGGWATGWQGLMRVVNGIVLLLGLVEAIRLTRASSFSTRILAQLHLLLVAAFVATCALIVPEERFTLAVYPMSLILSVSLIDRWLSDTTLVRRTTT